MSLDPTHAKENDLPNSMPHTEEDSEGCIYTLALNLQMKFSFK